MIVYVIFLRIHHIKVYFWSLKNPFWIFKVLILDEKLGVQRDLMISPCYLFFPRWTHCKLLVRLQKQSCHMGASLLLCGPRKAIWTNHQEKKGNKNLKKNQKTSKHVIFARKCLFLISNSERAYKKVRVCKIWWVFVERMASKHPKRA